MQSDLQLGPVLLTHQVQSIKLIERKNSVVVPAVRSDQDFLAQKGESSATAQVDLIFTGSEVQEELNTLCLLYKTAPILNCKNEMLNSVWNATGEDRKLNYIPVCIDSINIQTVPDVPESYRASIVLSRISVESVFGQDPIIYQGKNPGEGHENPTRAYYLNKWLESLRSTTPLIDTQSHTKISWDVADQPPDSLLEVINRELDVSGLSKEIDLGQPYAKVIGESLQVMTKMSKKTLIGQIYPFPQHMGYAGRIYSVDIVIDQSHPEGQKTFDQVCYLKDISDKLIKATPFFNRSKGWIVTSPILNYMSPTTRKLGLETGTSTLHPGSATMVPIMVSIETSDSPGIKTVHLQFAENNKDFLEENSSKLIEGGIDFEDLKAFYLFLMDKEESFRDTASAAGNSSISRALVGRGDTTLLENIEEYTTVWPIDESKVHFAYRAVDFRDKYGIINIDVFRAALLTSTFDSPFQGENSRLIDILQSLGLSTGVARVGRYRPTIVQSISTFVSTANLTLQGIDEDKHPEYREALNYIKNTLIDRVFDISNLHNIADGIKTGDSLTEFRAQVKDFIARKILNGLLGDFARFSDFSSETSELLSFIASSNIKFTGDFKDAMFQAIVDRKVGPAFIIEPYDIAGLHASFFILNSKYQIAKEYDVYKTVPSNPLATDGSTSLEQIQKSLRSKSNFPDLLLPSYEELFGDIWKEFAVTYLDLGIKNPEEPEFENVAPYEFAAVSKSDYVHPSAFFFNRKLIQTKIGDATSLIKELKTINSDYYKTLTLSLPFDIEDLKTLEDLILKKNAGADLSSIETQTLDRIITNSLSTAQQNPTEFNQTLLALTKEYGEEASKGPRRTPVIYVHHNYNYVQPRKVTFPGLGGEIYRVASERKFLSPNSNLPFIGVDEEMKSSNYLEDDFTFIRNLQDSSEKVMHSSLEQIGDVYESASTMWPACKVYLLDQRGYDLFKDDLTYSVNPIVSVRITQDKNDADLAVIEIADPLRNMQSAVFSPKNVFTVSEGENSSRVVSSDIEDFNLNGYLKRYKIEQGRPVKIDMGYDSNAENLKTVFTGRISEIVPGDVLTLVCQGWKAELINNQVSFSNDDPANWGARDLAVMALHAAGPQGFGTHYAQRDADLILKALKQYDPYTANSLVYNSIRNLQGVRTSEAGSRNLGSSIANYLISSLGFASIPKRNLGIDTRLKNIWYPDRPLSNNILGLRSYFEAFMPSWANDSWVVPMQPAWDVMKEASRHCWNCIVQVVPYDGAATLFMGHPDQPYFFTKGTRQSRKKYRERRQAFIKQEDNFTTEIVPGFYESSYYQDSRNTGRFTNLNDVTKVIASDPFNGVITLENKPGTLSTFIYPSYWTLKYLLSQVNNRSSIAGSSYGYAYYNTNYSRAFEEFIKSLETSVRETSLPYTLLEEVKSNVLGEAALTLYLSIYFNIPRSKVDLLYASQLESITLLLKGESIDSSILSSTINTTQVTNSISDFIATFYPTAQLSQGLNFVSSPELRTLEFTSTALAQIDSLEVEIRELIEVNRVRKVGSRHNTDYYNRLQTRSNTIFKTIKQKLVETKDLTQQFSWLQNLKNDLEKLESSFVEFSDTNLLDFKLFVIYFSNYLLENPEIQERAAALKEHIGQRLPSNMQAFRVHHFVDNNHNIIANNMVATTSEMWNSILIEHPKQGEAHDVVGNTNEVFTLERIASQVTWEYTPSTEVVGVYGLQVHPGLSLANKILKTKTELNAYTPELTAKLACVNLAEGIRRMYRGNIVIKGQHLKPHDRTVLYDGYTDMYGTVEVESVVHHFSSDEGWVTDYLPQMVCDANPGASIMETAAMEAVYKTIYKGVDFASEAIFWASIIATFGASAPGALALGRTGGVLRNFLPGLKNLLTKNPIKNARNGLNTIIKAAGQGAASGGGNPINIGIQTLKSVGGIASPYLNALIYGESFKAGLNAAQTLHLMNAFVVEAGEVKKLPVCLAPVIWQGRPLTAGLETDDALWTIAGSGFRATLADLNIAAQEVLKQLDIEISNPDYVFDKR